MKINIILEKAKFAKEKIIAYHATSKERLRSIIKNGLLLNYRKNGIGSGDYDTNYNFSYEPHEGIYFTTDYRYVKFLASYYSNPIIIVARIQNKSVHLDEDDLLKIIDNIGKNLVLNIDALIYDHYNDYNERSQYSEEFYNDIDKLTKKIADEAIENTKNILVTEYNLPKTTADNIMKRADYYIRSLIEKLIEGRLKKNTDIREEQKKLIKIFKNVVRNNLKDNSSSFPYRFSVPYNVGFRGANKIIGIIDINSNKAWGYSGTGFQKVETPLELLD